MIRLFAWTDVPNFGDLLSQEVVAWVSGRPVELVDAASPNKLVAVGSVLHSAVSGDVVWGTGVHPSGYHDFWKNTWEENIALEVLAVRGPITRDVLLAREISCPEIYGDPAILLPMMYPKTPQGISPAIVVPHFNDYPYFASNEGASFGLPVVNPACPWREVVDMILTAKIVISSSLHGIIVAESYGIPAIWLRLSHGEGYLKFQDYYSSTARAPRPIYKLEEAFDLLPKAPPDYSRMRDKLIEAFDLDLIEIICNKGSN